MPATRTDLKESRSRRSLDTRILGPSFTLNDGFQYNFRHVSGREFGEPFKETYEKNINHEFMEDPDDNLPKPTDSRPPPLALRDLECIKTLGVSQGKVLLVRSKRKSHYLDTPSVYALKAEPRKLHRDQAVDFAKAKHLSRKLDPQTEVALIRRHMLQTNDERSSLVDVGWHPFIAGLVQTFYDSQNLYMELEYMPGGNLRSLLQKSPGGMDPRDTVFYFSNIVCGIEYLHKLNIIHRDLKPENIMLNADGYLCLTDLGTSLRFDRYHGVERQWKDGAGTQSYMAPENDPINQHHPAYFPTALDWWSCGCILFEMATGKMVYHLINEMITVTELAEDGLNWPPGARVGKKLKHLVEGLLNPDPTIRLGSESGVEEIQGHPWLESVDWVKMRYRHYLPPFIPKPVDASTTWHKNPLPDQLTVPGLAIVQPPLHLAHDDRFPSRWAA